MTDGAFKATLALFALEAEKVRPSFLLIDATQFKHQFGPNVMQWRDDCIIPRYGAAGAKKFAFHMPAGFPNTMEAGGQRGFRWTSDLSDCMVFGTAARARLVQKSLTGNGKGEGIMSLTSAAEIATALNFLIFTLVAIWYVAPWLGTQQLAAALTPLVWVQVFRDVALQIFSAQHFGFLVSAPTRDMIAYGDVAGTILALISLVALRYRAE